MKLDNDLLICVDYNSNTPIFTHTLFEYSLINNHYEVQACMFVLIDVLKNEQCFIYLDTFVVCYCMIHRLMKL